MKLLHVTNTLNPAYGGCVEAVRQTALAQSKLGHRVEVVTLDGPDVEWIGQETALGVAGPAGRYGYNRRLVRWLRRGDFDAVILHGLWDYACLGAWRALRGSGTPYFIYAHGMLDPWFAQFRAKHLKKTVYWKLFAHRIFRDARGVVFTSEQERLLARRSFRPWACRELIAPLGVSRPAGEEEFASRFLDRFPHLRGRRIVLFFGRIHPKKGPDLVLRAMERFPALHLVMAGPDDEGFGGFGSDRVTWTGMLRTPELRFGALHAAEVFILPSHSENFGFAVVEALARGLPVLISKRVNIWNDIVDDGAGLAEEDDLPGTIRLLERWLPLDEAARAETRCNAVRCFEKRFEVLRATENLMRLLTTSVRSQESLQPADGHSERSHP